MAAEALREAVRELAPFRGTPAPFGGEAAPFWGTAPHGLISNRAL